MEYLPHGLVLATALLGLAPRFAAAQAFSSQREYDPVVVEGRRLGSWHGSADGTRLSLHVFQNGVFIPIPFQRDKRRKIHVNFNVGPNDAGYMPENCELGYFRELYDGPPGQGPRADFDDPTLHAYDEVVFLVKDALAGTQRATVHDWITDAGVANDRIELRVKDPRNGAERFVYVYRWASPPPSNQIDPRNYVNFTADTESPEEPCSSSVDACGWVRSQSVQGLETVATLDVHFDGNWITDELRVKEDGTRNPLPDLLQRFRYSTRSEDEYGWTNAGRPRFLGIVDGPVRVVRGVQGAASGRRTTKYEFIYPTRLVTRVNLRVHDLGELKAQINHDLSMIGEGASAPTRSYIFAATRFGDESADPRFIDYVNGLCAPTDCDPRGFQFDDWIQVNSPLRGAYVHIFQEPRSIPVVSNDKSTAYLDVTGGPDNSAGRYGRQWSNLACTEDGPPDNDGGCGDPEGDALFFARTEVNLVPRRLSGAADDVGQVVANQFSENTLQPVLTSAKQQYRDSEDPPPEPACVPTVGTSNPQTGAVDLSRSPAGPCAGTIGTRFYRAEDSGPFRFVKDLRTGSSFTDYGTIPGRTYQYKAVSYNIDNAETASSNIVSIAPTDTVPPPIPWNLSGAGGDGSATLGAEAPCTRNIAGLNFYVAMTSGGPYTKLNGSPVSPGQRPTSWTQSGRQNGSTYYFVVTAVDFSGNESSQSTEVSVVVGL